MSDMQQNNYTEGTGAAQPGPAADRWDALHRESFLKTQRKTEVQASDVPKLTDGKPKFELIPQPIATMVATHCAAPTQELLSSLIEFSGDPSQKRIDPVRRLAESALRYIQSKGRDPFEALAQVYTHGAKKYWEGSWVNVPLEMWLGGLRRHASACLSDLDSINPDFGLPHIDHVLWGAYTILLLLLREAENKAAGVTAGVVAREGEGEGA